MDDSKVHNPASGSITSALDCSVHADKAMKKHPPTGETPLVLSILLFADVLMNICVPFSICTSGKEHEAQAFQGTALHCFCLLILNCQEQKRSQSSSIKTSR